MRMFDEKQNIIRRLALFGVHEAFLQRQRGLVVEQAQIIMDQYSHR
jgi:hypothetical protein